VEDIKDVVGVVSTKWKNVSAYYEKEGKIYSIGYVVCRPALPEKRTDLLLGNKRLSHSSGAASLC
jgi:hypothetical protein